MKYTKYEKIYQMQNEEEDAYVIKSLINKNGKLKSIFKKDKNHSWYIIGASLYNLHDYISAIYCFKKSLKHRKDDDSCMFAIGNCYDRLGKFKLAEKWFRKSVTHAKDRESRDAAIYNLGNSLFDQKKYSKAIDCYKLVSYRDDETGELARKNLNLFKNTDD
jgi:tetratricopeptide (TPR) repeat protein